MFEKVPVNVKEVVGSFNHLWGCSHDRLAHDHLGLLQSKGGCFH